MNNKQTKTAGIFILVTFLIALMVFIGYLYYTNKNTVVYFNPNKRHAAEKLYYNIMNRNLETDYPASPEDVMEYNLNIIQLIYGNMIVEESLYENVILQQRKLFAKSLLEQNTLEQQTEVIKTAVSLLKEQQLSSYNISQLPTIFNPHDNDFCYIRVKQQLNNGEDFYWEYSLEKNEETDRWEIVLWTLTDEYYNPISENGELPAGKS